MLVHGTVTRGSKTFVILLLLLVTASISLHTFHFHSSNESSSVGCTLCEVVHGILPVLTITPVSVGCPVQAVELDEFVSDVRSPQGSNLSVRPPPTPLG